MILSIITGAILLVILIFSQIGAYKESFNPYSTVSRTEALEMEEETFKKLNQ